MDLIFLWQGKFLNIGFHVLRDLLPSNYCKGELDLVWDFMGMQIFLYGTNAKLAGHVSVPYLPHLLRCLECSGISWTAPDCLDKLITL